MKIQYFGDSDTLYMIFNSNPVVETRDLDENTLVDVDADGAVVGLTIEHAASHIDVTSFSYEQVSTAGTTKLASAASVAHVS